MTFRMTPSPNRMVLCARLVLAALSLWVALGMAEGLFRLALPRLPIEAHLALPRPLRHLAQPTKSGLVPRDYVAIVGDSNALGIGDGFGDRAGGDAWYGLASFLHARTGRDSVTWGAGGAGSLRGLVEEPARALAAVNALAGLRLAPPERILVLFYEGNDLNDNLRDLHTRYLPGHDPGRLFEDGYFRAFLDRQVAAHPEFQPRPPRLLLPAWLRGRLRPAADPNDGYVPEPNPLWSTHTNRLHVGGRTLEVPGGLQGPPMELTEEEVHIGAYVFGQALLALRERFPQSAIVVVYLPAVLTCYSPAAETVTAESFHYRGIVHPTAAIAPRSDLVFAAIAAIAHDLGLPLIDTRPSLRAAARDRLLHGPEDWYHLNREGMTVLGDSLLSPVP